MPIFSTLPIIPPITPNGDLHYSNPRGDLGHETPIAGLLPGLADIGDCRLLLLARERLDSLSLAWMRLGSRLWLERGWMRMGRLVRLGLQSPRRMRRDVLGRLVHGRSALLDVRWWRKLDRPALAWRQWHAARDV
jgi:hypothetical protein